MRTVTCGCGRPIAIRDESSSAPVKCIYCGALVNSAPAPTGGPARMRCPFCASEIDAGLNACPFCNENLARHAAGAGQPIKPAGLSTRRCPFCAESISVRDTVCPYCGNGAGARRSYVGAPAVGVPWENEPSAGFFSRWWRTWSASMFNADGFFSGMRWDGGIKAPLTYVLGFIGQVIGLAMVCGVPFLFLFMMSGTNAYRGGSSAMAGPVIIGVALLYVVFYVLAMIVSTFISAAIYHVCALMVGGRGTYEGSYRAVCYSFGSNVWAMIPYLGVIIQLVFHFIAMTHALSHAHGISKGRAFVAALLPVLVCCGGVIGFYVLLFASMTPHRY